MKKSCAFSVALHGRSPDVSERGLETFVIGLVLFVALHAILVPMYLLAPK